jgi:hypothetical protein
VTGAAVRASEPQIALEASDLEALAASLDALHAPLHMLEIGIGARGVPIAPLYLASARGSLRHVASCLAAHEARTLPPTRRSRELCPGSGIELRASADRPGLGDRRRVVGRRVEPAEGADVSPWARRADLGADLVACGDAAAFCQGPVGAALLFDALARHRWLHHASRSKWSTDISGAHALVSAISAGAGFPLPSPRTCGGLVDREVVELFRTLGWSRILSPQMPSEPSA